MHRCEYLNTDATSELTGISKSTLEKWRVYGGGIPFTKAGRCVKYALDDVRFWMAARRVSSTSDTLAYQWQSARTGTQQVEHAPDALLCLEPTSIISELGPTQ